MMMKFPLLMLLTTAATPIHSFTHPLQHKTTTLHPSTRLSYQHPSNKSEQDSSQSDPTNVWTVLANTERWISDTLDKSNKAANDRNKKLRQQQQQNDQEQPPMHYANEKKKKKKLEPRDNPYARKEVSYVCETGEELCVVVGGIFRRVREARELGESHGKSAGLRIGDAPFGTMRQTNVVVIPNCDEIAPFRTFDNLIQAINQARRRAREFVVVKSNNKDNNNQSGNEDWVVSINCAHLHPQYGMLTPSEELASMKHEEQEGEVDVNLQEYKKRRDEARRSPYPSVIVEVQSSPPPNFGAAKMESSAAKKEEEKKVDEDVTSEDVRKLEALFGMSAATKKADDPFYDALGEAFGNKQIAAQTPLRMAQNWVLDNDPAFNEESSTFTKSNT